MKFTYKFILLYTFFLLFSQSWASSIYLGQSRSPYNTNNTYAVGYSALSAMQNACNARRPGDYVELSPGTGLCGVASDGNRYTCRRASDGGLSGCTVFATINCPNSNDPICDELPEKDDGCDSEKVNSVGNPCNVATGNKYQNETDIKIGRSIVSRSYNSNNLYDSSLGKGWRHNYQKQIIISGDSAVLVSKTGRGEPWSKVNGVWENDGDSEDILTETASGFRIASKFGVVEDYDATGVILFSRNSNGFQTLYSYNTQGNYLSRVSNDYGEIIQFNYADGRLSSILGPQGEAYLYQYDALDNLVAVVYPDATPSDITDNPRKTYHYDYVDYPNHLTGITDENGNRYATYSYDANGKAITTEHATTTNSVGQEKFELNYQ